MRSPRASAAPKRLRRRGCRMPLRQRGLGSRASLDAIERAAQRAVKRAADALPGDFEQRAVVLDAMPSDVSTVRY